MSIDSLKNLLEIFVQKKDRSIAWAKSVETVIDEICKDNDEFDELQDYLASYRPGGGEYLYDEKEMEMICIKVLRKISNSTW